MHIIIIIKYKANILLFFFIITDRYRKLWRLLSWWRHRWNPTPCYVCHTAATRPSKECQTLVLGRVHSRWYRSRLHSSSPSMPSSRKTTV